jgi:D-beta-D-heptose 7-phosphate kinase/D-beta-D-heptose 1-phosphate adenosyltransferase
MPKEVIMKTVAVAGHFDPFHEGHLLHIVEASKLGDYLYVFVSSDGDAVTKKGKVNIEQSWRIEIVRLITRGLGIMGVVLPTLDEDGTQTKTLMHYKPDIFAKGGDRTPDNMPESELRVCEEINCKIMYGVGKQLNESSKMVMV